MISYRGEVVTLGGCARDLLSLKRGDSTWRLERTGRDHSEKEAADVREVGHSPGLHLRHRAGLEELAHEPKSDQPCGRNESDPHEQEESQDSADPIPWI